MSLKEVLDQSPGASGAITLAPGELLVSKNSADMLILPGLGTSIGLVLYDAVNKVGGAAHIVLPVFDKEKDSVGTFAKISSM